MLVLPAAAGSALIFVHDAAQRYPFYRQSLRFPRVALHAVQLSLDAMVVAIHMFDRLGHSSVLCLLIAVLMVKMPAAVLIQWL